MYHRPFAKSIKAARQNENSPSRPKFRKNIFNFSFLAYSIISRSVKQGGDGNLLVNPCDCLSKKLCYAEIFYLVAGFCGQVRNGVQKQKTEDLSNRSAVNTFDVVPYGARENGIFNYVDPLDQQSNAGKYGAKGVTDSEAIKAFKPFDTQTYKQGTAGTKSVDCHQFVEEGLNKLNFIWVDKNGNNITKKIQQLNTTQINTLAAEGDLFIQDKTGQNRSIDVAVTTGHIKILVKNEEGKNNNLRMG